MSYAYFLLAGLCLAGLLVRDTYELLKLAGRIDTRRKALLAALVLAMSCFLGAWPVICPLDPWRMRLPAFVPWTGAGMIVIAAVLMFVALIQLRGVENIDHLVTTGLFARLRHPMYTGFILWIAGWLVSCGALASLVVGLMGIASILWWRSLEERALVSEYGETYKAYRRRTWF